MAFPPWLRTLVYLLLLVLGLIGLIAALVQLITPMLPLTVSRARIDNVPPIPVTVFTNTPENPGPAVVIAHGFAGSQQLMYAFATTLAHNGYTAVTFDFPGHGQNVRPLRGGIDNEEGREVRYEQLVAVLNQVVTFARDRERSNGRVALLGHSMGSEAALRYVQEQPDEIQAVVAVSPMYEGAQLAEVPNLLVLTGALEFGLRPFAQEVANAAADGAGETNATYGSFEEGTARRVVFVPGAEHVGILFNRTSMDEALNWLNASFQRPERDGTPYLDGRAPWLVLLYLSAIVLFWPFSLLIQPVVRQAAETTSATGRVRWIWFAALVVVPALITPLLLWLVPIDLRRILPILVGGPLTLHFALYGLLTAIGLIVQYLVARKAAAFRALALRHPSVPLAIVLLVVGYIFLLFGVPSQFFVLNYFPPLERLFIFVIVLVGLLPYFLADEWLTRGPEAPAGAYALTKVFFILSLGIAVALNPGLFFLIIIAPLFVAYFVVYGLFSWRLYQRSGTIWVGALVNTIIFAWTIAAIFPLVS